LRNATGACLRQKRANGGAVTAWRALAGKGEGEWRGVSGAQEKSGVRTLYRRGAVPGGRAQKRNNAGTKREQRREQSGNKPGTSREQAGNKPGTSREQAGNKPGISRE
jgi:hypothetical protein